MATLTRLRGLLGLQTTAVRAAHRTHQTAVGGLRGSAYVDFPVAVHIETLALCNAACAFCQYPALERIGERMSAEMIAEIINELAAWLPREHVFSMILSGVSEPLLDKRLVDIIRQVNERLPSANVHINTNGAALDGDLLDRLLSVRVGALSVSLNDHRAAECQALMGVSATVHARTLAAIRLLEDYRARGAIGFPLGLTRAGDGSPVDGEFLAWCRENYPAWGHYVSTPFAWLGDPPVSTDVPDIGCTHWFDLTIRSTGEVAWCCLDGHVKHKRGDVGAAPLREIYSDPAWRALRVEAITRRRVPQCAACTHA